MFGTEYIAQICRDTGETAAVTCHYDKQEYLKQDYLLYITKNQHCYNFQYKEPCIYHISAEIVRQCSPPQTTAAVEDTHNTYDACCRYSTHASGFLQDWRCNRQKRNSTGDVNKQHKP